MALATRAATLDVMARITIFAVLFAVVSASGCAEDCDTVEPAYAGEASDEVWRVFVGARDDARTGDDAATITTPADDAVLGKADTLTVNWDSPLKVGAFSPIKQRILKAKRHAPKALFERVSEFFIPVAHAHLAPITSDVYFVEVDVPGRTCPVSVLTTELSATFSDDDQALITDADGTRTIRVMSAFVTQNRITEGPFRAAPVRFTVQ